MTPPKALRSYYGWYLTGTGLMLHFPSPTSAAHGLCGAKLAPHRTDDHRSEGVYHVRCHRCVTKAKT